MIVILILVPVNRGVNSLTDMEILKLQEYRYSKLCRLECKTADSYNLLFRYMDNKNTLSGHIYNVVYLDCFKSIMRDVFELLEINGGNNNE